MPSNPYAPLIAQAASLKNELLRAVIDFVANNGGAYRMKTGVLTIAESEEAVYLDLVQFNADGTVVFTESEESATRRREIQCCDSDHIELLGLSAAPSDTLVTILESIGAS